MFNNFTVSVDLVATGTKIKELRYQNHYTVADLAEIVGSSENTIFKWQRGDCLPTIDNLLILSKLFGTPMDDIIQSKERGDEPLSHINGFFFYWSFRPYSSDSDYLLEEHYLFFINFPILMVVAKEPLCVVGVILDELKVICL